MGWIGCIRCEKSRRDFVARTFALIALVPLILHRVSWNYEMIPNAPRHYTTHQNMNLGSNRVDWVRLMRKIPTRLRGTNFRTSSARFAPSSVRQPNGPKYTQIVQNAAKCQFRVQWGGLGAFVAKTSNATSWHDLLHYFGPFCTEFCKAI